MECPLCGMISATNADLVGFSNSVEAVTQIEKDLGTILSSKVPTVFVLMNRPNKYLKVVDACVELEQKIKIAFSMFSADPASATILQTAYSRAGRHRKLIEAKFSEINTLFKGSIAILLVLFFVLSSLLERILIAFDSAVVAERVHNIADAMNHTAISFVFVGVLIYIAATSYNAKRLFYS
jgi:hypothetical protein